MDATRRGLYLREMSGHVIWANWVAVIWIVMFAWQLTVSTDKKAQLAATSYAEVKIFYKRNYNI
ncbi:hypothetical protein LX03_02875 [Limosilactobacillus mucosae]|uniref:Uncharacterized protein n=1 Tax=Limosilactobacillus mucosae TaxID=97478 RepID=A0A099YCW1_LIMMU|nr:hypothetical protein LX03_02875 [Limosilactobacillus mucosae]